MTNNTLSPIQDTQTQDDEIIRQRQSEACARLEEELTRTKIPPPAPRLVPPEKFALKNLSEKNPRRLNPGKNGAPGVVQNTKQKRRYPLSGAFVW
ncbi:hypothetical protein ACISSW_28185 [Escherichia coli]